jgi:hypothetical protein
LENDCPPTDHRVGKLEMPPNDEMVFSGAHEEGESSQFAP